MTLTPIALSFELTEGVNGRVQLTPYGRFFASDGREDTGGWYVDDSNGYFLADELNNRKVEAMFDYEHKTLRAKEFAEPNPAAGWFKNTEYISGKGLFVDVQWTDKAREQIKSGEYRYLSPLFVADAQGKVVKIVNAALTNTPACHEIAEVYALSADFIQLQKEGNSPMLKLLQQLFDAPNATEAEITEKLNALSAAKTESQVALSAVYDELKTQKTQVVALNAQVKNPDPTKYVALSQMQAVQAELNKERAERNAEKAEALITTALSQGKLLPAQKEWAENLAKADLNALSAYLNATPANPALGGNQSQEQPKGGVVALSAEEKEAARIMGKSEADYIKIKQKQEGK
ncbi:MULTISPECIES: phage protease [Glaesserella]|uniref:I protein n=1 Tax=Glaesserella australis TaxID=2094024 RepID=A0A328BW62_9PAST|nr:MULTISPECIES: phage protease [Glaesserella]AUI65204.1 hypothetical protein CJD39_00820 [Glaesserella sp. 15-184]RAL18476.1 hypothetical protein C5N92_07110 [Glaesserella australis]